MFTKRHVGLAVFALVAMTGATAVSAFAQQVEVHPYIGGFWPAVTNDDGRFKTQSMYGLKGGVMVTPEVELGAHLGYINNLATGAGGNFWDRLNPFADSAAHGVMWEATADFQLNNRHPFGARVVPYLGFGLGGLTANVAKTSTGTRNILLAPGTSILNMSDNAATPFVGLSNHDTFFMFSYGGGVKALRLWGPMGLRGEIKGRTMPNVFGRTVTWPEVSVGPTFSWGEQ